MDVEIWRPAPGFEDEGYDVSNWGRMRTWRYPGCRHSKYQWPAARRAKAKILRPRANTSGYLQHNLTKAGKCKNGYVHRLVALAFLNRPDGSNVVHHLDHNKPNNRADNLEWVTPHVNLQAAHQHYNGCHVVACPNCWHRFSVHPPPSTI